MRSWEGTVAAVKIKKIIRISFAAAGFICLLWFAVPLFLGASFHIGTITGMILSLMLFLYGVFMGKINKAVKHIWKHIVGKIVFIIIMTAAAAILCLAAACIVSMASVENEADCMADTVIVLGCDITEDGPGEMLKRRLDLAAQYLEKNPDAVCIVCGGQLEGESRSEAEVMYGYLTEKGIDPERIYIEDESEDTQQNLAFAKEIIDENGLSNEAVIITSGFHMYRALARAKESGIEPHALACKTPPGLWPAAYIREMYGILEMWFL